MKEGVESGKENVESVEEEEADLDTTPVETPPIRTPSPFAQVQEWS